MYVLHLYLARVWTNPRTGTSRFDELDRFEAASRASRLSAPSYGSAARFVESRRAHSAAVFFPD